MQERNPSRKEIAARAATFMVGAIVAISGAIVTEINVANGNYPNAALFAALSLWGTLISLASLDRGASWEFYNRYGPPLRITSAEKSQTKGKDRATSSS